MEKHEQIYELFWCVITHFSEVKQTMVRKLDTYWRWLSLQSSQYKPNATQDLQTKIFYVIWIKEGLARDDSKYGYDSYGQNL